MEERELPPGDAVLLYSDGVPKALNGERAECGDKRLLEATRQNCQPSLPELLVAAVDQARRFSPREPADDIRAWARSRTARTVRSGAWG